MGFRVTMIYYSSLSRIKLGFFCHYQLQNPSLYGGRIYVMQKGPDTCPGSDPLMLALFTLRER